MSLQHREVQGNVYRADENSGNGLQVFMGKNSLFSIFRHIQDILYSLTVPMTDLKTAPEQILAIDQEYCGPRHNLLP